MARPTTKPSASIGEEETPKPMFSDIYEAPEAWRHIGFTPITVAQLNAILQRAHELGDEGAPDYGKAKQEFREQNHIEDGQWVAGPASTKE